jgi:hypothetical protein
MNRAANLRAALLALAAITGTGISARADQPGPEAGAGMFSPPAGPMILMRELRRSLSDGNEVVTRRRYEIRFVTEAGGFRVDGRLVSAEAEVPPKLQMLAALERARGDEGLFPIHLTARGMIVEQQAEASVGTPQTRKLAESMIARAPLPTGERSGALGFVSALLAHPEVAGGHWPAELFHPMTGTCADTNSYPMPGGGTGTVTVTIDAHGDGPGGLLQSFERTVVTESGGAPQQSRERWTLAPPAK